MHRRTDVTSGSNRIYYDVASSFLSDGPHHVQIKVTYLDGPTARFNLEHPSPTGLVSSLEVVTSNSGQWKTVTFATDSLLLDTDLLDGMDFRLSNTGPADLTVRFVRVIKSGVP